MAKIDFDQDGVGHFIADNFLKVPSYQRSFAWEISHVQDLFEDIKNSHHEDYFIGTIVVTVTDKGDYLEIVDGQQRLATINIFFAVIRDLLKREKNDTKSKHVETEYLWKESLRDEDKKQKLVLNNMDNEFYLRRVIENKTKPEPNKESHNRILEAYNYIKDFVNNKYENEKLDGIFDLVDFIEKKVKIIIPIIYFDGNTILILHLYPDYYCKHPCSNYECQSEWAEQSHEIDCNKSKHCHYYRSNRAYYNPKSYDGKYKPESPYPAVIPKY